MLDTPFETSHVNLATLSKGLSAAQLRKTYKEIVQDSFKNEEDECATLTDPQQLENLVDLLMSYKDIIALEDDEVPICPLMKFSVTLKDDAPKVLYRPQYRLPHKYIKHIEEWVEDSLHKGYIRPVSSEHSAPLLIIPKKSGEARVVVDYRFLNSHTIVTRFPI